MRGRSCDATGSTSSRSTHTCDHTSISAALDDLRTRSRTAAAHSVHWSMFACIDQHVDQSMFHCLLCLNQCALACVSTASMFASNQTACQRKKRLRQRKTCAARQ